MDAANALKDVLQRVRELRVEWPFLYLLFHEGACTLCRPERFFDLAVTTQCVSQIDQSGAQPIGNIGFTPKTLMEIFQYHYALPRCGDAGRVVTA